MCTVTYIPKEAGFILTSNRDEAPKRAANEISNINANGRSVYFPKDKGAGGTWIATDQEGTTLCLMNGAFEKHERKSSYRRSRGLMVLDYYFFQSFHHFCDSYEFYNMEAFTLVVVEQNNLYILRWDEKERHIEEADSQGKHIWASPTLYSKEKRVKRKEWFKDWQQVGDFSLASINQFHRFGGEGDHQNDLVMNRSELVKTVSITNIEKKDKNTILQHHQLLEDEIQKIQLPLPLGIGQFV